MAEKLSCLLCLGALQKDMGAQSCYFFMSVSLFSRSASWLLLFPDRAYKSCADMVLPTMRNHWKLSGYLDQCPESKFPHKRL